jgi:TP901 family phage tail tape measure protein
MALSAEVANLIVALKLDDSGFSGKLNKAAGQLKSMDRGLSQMGRGAGQFAGGVGRLADRTALLAGAGIAAVVTTAASFEQAEASIRKTVGGTEEEVDDLIATVKNMSRTVPLSFEELAAIAAEGGALGITTAGLDEFTDVVARLGVSTDLTTEQAASALGQLSNVLGLSEEDLQQFGDALVALGNDGASTESQILDMTARFGAAGKMAGLSDEEILALSSTVASMGIEAEAGGGALSRLFNNMTLDIGTASDEAQAMAGAMDMSLGELKTAWDQDAGAVFEDLLGYINELDQFEAAQFLQDLGITNTRDINAIMLLAEGVDEYGRQLGVAEGATNELNKESDAFFNTTAGKWKTTVNNARLAADTIGQEVLPVVNELMDEFVTFLSDPATQQGIKEFATDLAGGIRGFVDQMKGTDFSGIIGGLKLTAEIAKGAFDAFRSLPQPIQQLAIAALVANKVTGGAIGQIAAGLGNLVLGSLKTITAGHVTVIGGTVTGGPGGVPTGGGGGFGGSLLNGLKTGAALASPVLAGVAAVEVINFQNMRNEATGHLEGILDDMPSRTGAEIDESISRIQAEINKERPFLEGILFNTNVKPLLEEQIADLQDVKTHTERAAAGAWEAIPVSTKKAIDFLNSNEATRASNMMSVVRGQKDAINNLNANEGTRAANLMSLARTSNAYGSRTASAAERTANKDFSFDPKITSNVDVTVPITNIVNSTVIQTQLHRLRTTVGGGGFI